jgi:hypothetical protein
MRWARHAEWKCMQKFSRKTRRKERTWEILGTGKRIILKYIMKKQDVTVWTGRLKWLSIKSEAGSCEYGNKPSWFRKGREFLASTKF